MVFMVWILIFIIGIAIALSVLWGIALILTSKVTPSWFKGVLIFGILFLPIFIVSENTQFFLVPLFILWGVLGYIPVMSFADKIVQAVSQDASQVVTILVVYVVYIIIGALIGLIYDYVKSRRRGVIV